MSEHFSYGQRGVASDVEYGVDGGRVIWNGTLFQMRETDGATDARVQVADAVADADAVNFGLVKGLLDGVVWKESSRLGTTVALVDNGWTIAGSGVGKTLTSPTTATSNNDFDGVTAVVGDRILVKDEDAADQESNGIYTLTQAADGAGDSAILTRATDMDEDVNAAGEDEVRPGASTFITEGTQSGRQYTVLGAGPITVDTDDIIWTQTNTQSAADPLIRLATLGTGATQSIGTVLPVSSKVQDVKLEVTTIYDVTATIEIRDDAPTTYQPTNENKPKQLGLYVSEVAGHVVAGGTRQLQAIVGNTPAAGVAEVVVNYKI